MIKTLGYSLAEMQQMGVNLFETIMHPEDFPNALRAMELFIAGVERHYDTCRFHKKSTGAWSWFYGIVIIHERDKDDKAKTLFCSFLELNSLQLSIQFGQIMPLSIDNASEIKPLSRREKELLPYLAKGLSNKEIAELTFNSPNTIKTHVESIMHILEIHSRVKLAIFLKDIGY